MHTEPRHSAQELDAIIARLKKGDLSAMQQVTGENVVPLLDRANGDEELLRLLRTKI